MTVTVTAPVWYARAEAAARGDGRSDTPFRTLDEVEAAAQADQRIYLFRRSGDSLPLAGDGTVQLKDGQALLGSAVDLTDGGTTLYSGGGALRPVIPGTQVLLAVDNDVDAVVVGAFGSSSIATTVASSSFLGIVNDSVAFGGNGASTGTSWITLAYNTFTGSVGRDGGVDVAGQATMNVDVEITGNVFTSIGGPSVVQLLATASAVLDGTVSNNTVLDAAGRAIYAHSAEAATAELVIRGNTISNSGREAIRLWLYDNSPGTSLRSTLRATVTLNLVNGHNAAAPGGFGGIVVVADSVDGDVLDLQLTGNSVVGTPTDPVRCGGVACVDYYLANVGGAFRLEEVPDTAATVATAAYVNATNDPGPVTIIGTITLSDGVEITGA